MIEDYTNLKLELVPISFGDATGFEFDS